MPAAFGRRHRAVLKGFGPPLLTGGARVEPLQELVGGAVDFLTASVSGVTRDYLMVESGETVEPGFGRPGFAKSERRMWFAKPCWRRWDPHQARRDWGKSYESWEWDGVGADHAARMLAGRERVAPSRVDVRFDYACQGDFKPDDLVELMRPVADRKGLADERVSKDGIATRYVGSRKGLKFIRVYRKDLQSEVFAFHRGPLMRVELELRKEEAVAWWKPWSESPEAGLASAARIIHELTGFRPFEKVGDLPKPEADHDLDEAQQLFEFVKQYGSRMTEWIDEGVDVERLCRRAVEGASDEAKRRSGLRRQRIAQIGGERLTWLVGCFVRQRSLEGREG